MRWRRGCLLFSAIAIFSAAALGQQGGQSPVGNSSSSRVPRKPTAAANSTLGAGSVSNGVYRNRSLGLSCTIPAGWVLRTEEVNARPEGSPNEDGGSVLVAAFARPPLAHGEDVNSSILIAAESGSAYPGLKEAAQYFGPITEVAKAQGFETEGEPYEFAVGARALVREDFRKNVGTRVMRQSTLAMLAKGYAVSFTFIGGTEDEVEELIEGLNFAAGAKPGVKSK